MIEEHAYDGIDLSIALTRDVHERLSGHLDRGPEQEDLTFALWRPSRGLSRLSAVVQHVVWPEHGDRHVHGNVSFTPEYIQRTLEVAAGGGYGVVLLHSHLGPGWQGMSSDDVVAERDRLAGAVAARTGLPLVGMTWATDEAWSGRFWLRCGRGMYVRRWASSVRVVGRHLGVTYHPELRPSSPSSSAQVATISVWGEDKQADLARLHVGIIGLGSVGSMVAESLSRVGVTRITLIDHDLIEERNLDRTLGAFPSDALTHTPKVAVATRLVSQTHTAAHLDIRPYHGSLLTQEGLDHALDCDVLFSCVDRPAPRHMLNAIAYAHLIPVIDGGILAKVNDRGLVHADWRIHTVGPNRPCMVCVGGLRHEEIALDLAGLLDDPAYIQSLDPSLNPLLARQNVFPFSMSVAAHEVLQFVGLATGLTRLGGVGAQMYHCYRGTMEVNDATSCVDGCDYSALTATAADLSGNCRS